MSVTKDFLNINQNSLFNQLIPHVFQDEIETLKGFWENNRKTSETNNFNLDDIQVLINNDYCDDHLITAVIQLDFDQLDYENYDYAGIGVLNFNKAPPLPSRRPLTSRLRPNRRRPSSKISKRCKKDMCLKFSSSKLNEKYQNLSTAT